VAKSPVRQPHNGSKQGQAQHLSSQEREVLRLIAEGVRLPTIAHQLGISPTAVALLRRGIMRKLELRTVAALTHYAIREGLVAP
jgi:DNA-binding NarL/FixJ family response regulator